VREPSSELTGWERLRRVGILAVSLQRAPRLLHSRILAGELPRLPSSFCFAKVPRLPSSATIVAAKVYGLRMWSPDVVSEMVGSLVLRCGKPYGTPFKCRPHVSTRPPSRIRYEKKNPMVSVRLTRSLKEILDDSKKDACREGRHQTDAQMGCG